MSKMSPPVASNVAGKSLQWNTYPSEKYEFVSWDEDIPNIWKNKIHVPNHQPVYIYMFHMFPIQKTAIRFRGFVANQVTHRPDRPAGSDSFTNT
jgi:hypothetical protein